MSAELWVSAATFRRGVAEKISFILLNLIDLILTSFALSLGLNELNPFMRSLISSPVQLMVFKVGMPILIAWLVPGKFLIPAVILLSLVVGWDIKELLLFLL